MLFPIRHRLIPGPSPVLPRNIILSRIVLLFLCFSLSCINTHPVQTDYTFYVFPPGLNVFLFLYTFSPLVLVSSKEEEEDEEEEEEEEEEVEEEERASRDPPRVGYDSVLTLLCSITPIRCHANVCFASQLFVYANVPFA